MPEEQKPELSKWQKRKAFLLGATLGTVQTFGNACIAAFSFFTNADINFSFGPKNEGEYGKTYWRGASAGIGFLCGLTAGLATANPAVGVGVGVAVGGSGLAVTSLTHSKKSQTKAQEQLQAPETPSKKEEQQRDNSPQQQQEHSTTKKYGQHLADQIQEHEVRNHRELDTPRTARSTQQRQSGSQQK